MSVVHKIRVVHLQLIWGFYLRLPVTKSFHWDLTAEQADAVGAARAAGSTRTMLEIGEYAVIVDGVRHGHVVNHVFEGDPVDGSPMPEGLTHAGVDPNEGKGGEPAAPREEGAVKGQVAHRAPDGMTVFR